MTVLEPTTDAPLAYSDADTWRRLAQMWAVALVVLRLAPRALAVLIFAPAWCGSAAAAILWFGARAGWRDMRAFTQVDEPEKVYVVTEDEE